MIEKITFYGLRRGKLLETENSEVIDIPGNWPPARFEALVAETAKTARKRK